MQMNMKEKESWDSDPHIRLVDFNPNYIVKTKEGNYGDNQEEDITFVNIYAHNMGTPKYTEQILKDIKGEIDINTIIIGGFNISITSMDGSSIQKINKETVTLKDTLDQVA